MPPILCVVGSSGAGKTTLVEGLVAELSRRGLRVASVKHCPHGFDLEPQGKDSQRHLKAGAHRVVMSAPDSLALLEQRSQEASLEEVTLLLGPDHDLVLAEGYHGAKAPKIEVFRQGVSDRLLTPEEHLLAVVTDTPLETKAPQLAPQDLPALAELVLREVVEAAPAEEVSLRVDGQMVRLNPFVRRLIARTVAGMLSALEGAGEVQQVELAVRRRG